MWQKLSRGLSIAIVLLVSGITDLVTGVFNFLAYSADIACVGLLILYICLRLKLPSL